MSSTSERPYPIGVAIATKDKQRIGKIHRNGTSHVPTAKRNRQTFHTRCGLRLHEAFPFEVVPGDTVPLCSKCW